MRYRIRVELFTSVFTLGILFNNAWFPQMSYKMRSIYLPPTLKGRWEMQSDMLGWQNHAEYKSI